MISIVLLVALVLALITHAGVFAIERIYPPRGKIIDVAGGRMHVVDLAPRDAVASATPVVLIHGASSNLESMRQPLGEKLAASHRVILLDRPGHGWSTRTRRGDSSPAIQAAMIDEALGKLGIARAIFVTHSLAGAIGPALALNHPARVAGLIMLAPVTHQWDGGVGRVNDLIATPVLGDIFANTIVLPVGLMLMDAGAKTVFKPQAVPENYARDTAVPLLLRPRNFIINAVDLTDLRAGVMQQMTRYGEIKQPCVVIHGTADTIVSIDVHARRFVREAQDARLIELPGIGHMVQNAATDVVIEAVDAMARATAGVGSGVTRR